MEKYYCVSRLAFGLVLLLSSQAWADAPTEGHEAAGEVCDQPCPDGMAKRFEYRGKSSGGLRFSGGGCLDLGIEYDTKSEGTCILNCVPHEPCESNKRHCVDSNGAACIPKSMPCPHVLRAIQSGVVMPSMRSSTTTLARSAKTEEDERIRRQAMEAAERERRQMRTRARDGTWIERLHGNLHKWRSGTHREAFVTATHITEYVDECVKEARKTRWVNKKEPGCVSIDKWDRDCTERVLETSTECVSWRINARRVWSIAVNEITSVCSEDNYTTDNELRIHMADGTMRSFWIGGEEHAPSLARSFRRLAGFPTTGGTECD
jgi:hypothetical protein